MRNGTCIKCGHASVRQLTDGIYDGQGRGVSVNDGSMIRYPQSYETFLCTACGYWENYLTNTDLLRRLADGAGGWAPPA